MSKTYDTGDMPISDHPDFKEAVPLVVEGIDIPISQHPNFVKPFLKIINDFDRIIEIGTWKGGFTLFLFKNKKNDCELISYEIDPLIIEIPSKYNIDVRIGDCFSEKIHNEIKELIIDPNKKVLLLCDGGDKVNEVKTFCKYLKPTDVIMCHDYADNFKDWVKCALPIGWVGFVESSHDALLDTIKNVNLNKYKYYDDFKNIFWGSFTRNSNPQNYYSQFGEDKILEEYFRKDYVGGCIDIGASNGISINNTKHFEENGWYCLCIEPIPIFYEQLKINRLHTLNYAISQVNDKLDFTVVNLNGEIGEACSSLSVDEKLIQKFKDMGFLVTSDSIKVESITLDYCIENFYKHDKIDFISIDTEGTELDILKSFSLEKYNPQVLVIENNYNDPDIEIYLELFGYKKDRRLEVNDFYIKR